ncbi:MAG TPA: alpha-L-rhamnosidase C-terminal domain-containing protein [Mycobacteriales bacterium]|nr:alpha-L-rhamnosidase C-terminal domain-containing protein [Mycobacteriales bacterium]HWA68023.1 alpha-L-rhamnosidase C-terminal domain-containing protein [Mycobacteriales bacterium]
MRRSPLVGLLAAAAAVATATVSPATARPVSTDRPAYPTAAALSQTPVPTDPGWRRYDEAPRSAQVAPVAIASVSGQVSDPLALTTPTTADATTLTYRVGGPAPSLLLDYGKDVGGYPTFDVTRTSGTSIGATYSETLRNLGVDSATSVDLFQAGDIARSDVFPILSPGVVEGTLVQGGERYERLTLATPGSVTLRSAGIRFTPLRETPSRMRGHFLSSDDLLNRIWYAGAYTLNINQLTPGTRVALGQVNRRHLLLDGAKRDRAVWSGDHMISDLTDYYVSDPVYARDSDALFLDHPASASSFVTPAAGLMALPGPLPGACSPNPLVLDDGCVTWSTSYSLAVIPAVYNYFRFTADAAFVRAHWAAVLRQMRWDATQTAPDGLVKVDATDDASWNLEMISGELTYVNALYVLALDDAAKLAHVVGDHTDASAWRHTALAVKRTVNRELWNPRTHVYDAGTTLRDNYVQDANVTAILAGIPGRSRARQILAVLARKLHTRFGPLVAARPAPTAYKLDISPYMGSFNVLADFATGRAGAALGLIRQEWGYMVDHDPGGVEWERIQLDGLPAGGSLGAVSDSMAHAWSTGPTPALSEYVLGVSPAAPGFASWQVSPQPAGLRWAQGTVPTPHGPISVRWRRPRTGEFVMTVHSPPGEHGTVSVPTDSRHATLARDGVVIWRDGHAVGGSGARRVGARVDVAQQAGTSTYAAAG